MPRPLPGKPVAFNANSAAVGRAAGNAARMMYTRAVTKGAMQAAPDQVSEHGAGQMAGGGGSPDANFALQRLHQMVASGLLGGMPQHMNDPAQVWRTLSQSMGSNPDALKQFLAYLQTGASGVHQQAQQPGPYIGT